MGYDQFGSCFRRRADLGSWRAATPSFGAPRWLDVRPSVVPYGQRRPRAAAVGGGIFLMLLLFLLLWFNLLRGDALLDLLIVDLRPCRLAGE